MIHIFNALFELLYSIFGAIFTSIADGIELCIPVKNTQDYSAAFVEPDEVLEVDGQGFYIANYSTKNICGDHLICCGTTSSGKSSNLVYPTLLKNHTHSFLVIDLFKDLYNGSASYLQSIGYRVLELNFNGVNTQGFNLLLKCTSHTDVYRMAHTIIVNSLEDSNFDYWAQSAEQILQFYMKLVLDYEQESNKNMVFVVELIRKFCYAPKEIDSIVLNTKNSLLISEYKALISTPEKTLKSSLSTLLVALRVFEIPTIQQMIRHDSINFSDFFDRKTVLFITHADGNLYKSIIATFFESFFSYVLKRPPYTYVNPVMMLLDECAMIKISLPQALATARKQGLSIASFWQDFAQVERIYGKHDASVILSNSNNKIFMPGTKSLETCVMLERLLGRCTYFDFDTNQKKVTELLNIQQLRELDKILLLTGISKPVLLDSYPFYEDKVLLKRSQMPALELPHNEEPEDEA